MREILFPLSQNDKAKKYPITPEAKACKKVAPKNLKLLIITVSLNKNGLPTENKTKVFSRAAKPKAATII